MSIKEREDWPCPEEGILETALRPLVEGREEKKGVQGIDCLKHRIKDSEIAESKGYLGFLLITR